MMPLEWHDVVGTIGVVLIVGTYFLLQAGRIRNDTPLFSVLNAAGAALILLSLIEAFNFSAFVVELFWLLISLYGLAKSLRRGGRLAD